MLLRPGRFANVTSVLALVVALSGTGYAVATVTGADVVNGSLTGRDLADGSVRSIDVRGLSARDLARNALPGAAAGRYDALALAAGPNNQVDLTTEVFDTAGMYDPGEDLIQVPMNGTYLVTAAIDTETAVPQRQARIVVNGVVLRIDQLADDSAGTSMSVTAVMRLSAGDQVMLGWFGGSPTQLIDWSGEVAGAYLAVQMLSR